MIISVTNIDLCKEVNLLRRRDVKELLTSARMLPSRIITVSSEALIGRTENIVGSRKHWPKARQNLLSKAKLEEKFEKCNKKGTLRRKNKENQK